MIEQDPFSYAEIPRRTHEGAEVPLDGTEVRADFQKTSPHVGSYEYGVALARAAARKKEITDAAKPEGPPRAPESVTVINIGRGAVWMRRAYDAEFPEAA